MVFLENLHRQTKGPPCEKPCTKIPWALDHGCKGMSFSITDTTIFMS